MALAESAGADASMHDELEQQLREKDTLLRELQHRVKNNLQMITALIRLEARNVPTTRPAKVRPPGRPGRGAGPALSIALGDDGRTRASISASISARSPRR